METSQEEGGSEYIKLKGDVRFKGVTFSYDGVKTVLDDVSFMQSQDKR